jgi:hypothetical protein
MASLLAGASVALPRIPMVAPTELAQRSDGIREQVSAASRNDVQDAESASDRISVAVSGISRRYGENSIESVQASTEAGIALIRDWQRFDLALPHIERSLQLSRTVFGTDHRETAYALQDLAVVRHELRPELFVQWSGPLTREAIAVRTRVIGADHRETAGSERYLASWLYGSWRKQRARSARSPMLVEARQLVGHALVVLEKAYGVDHFEVIELRYLQLQIALAMQDFALAESLAGDLLFKYQAPCNVAAGQPGARELLARALRGQLRPVEAEAVVREATPEECAVLDVLR